MTVMPFILTRSCPVPLQNPTESLIHQGDLKRRILKPIDTPQNLFNARLNFSSDYCEFYFYDKKSDKCVGVFSLQDLDEDNIQVKSVVKSDVYAVTPQLVLAAPYQSHMVTSEIYRSFLTGKRVFVTKGRAKGESSLWDSLTNLPMVSLYFTSDGKPASKLNKNAWRFLGNKKHFKENPNGRPLRDNP